MGNHVNPGTVPNLEDFIPPGQHDIYALGFQEMPGKGREQWVHEIKAHVMNIAGESASLSVSQLVDVSLLWVVGCGL